MKKILSTILIVLAFGANAQIGYGVKGGLNYSQISGDNNGDQKFKTGVNAGLFANIPVANSFSIQPEVLFSTEGATIDDSGTLDLKYLNFPIMAQYKYKGFYGEFGPQLGFNLSADAKNGGQSRDFKSSINPTSFALNLGFGYKLENGLGFNLRYSQGLTNIYKSDDSIVGKTTNQNAVFNLGVQYDLSSLFKSSKK
jgi:hypothetical protein